MGNNEPDVRSGMDVYDSNQDKIGTVDQVYPGGTTRAVETGSGVVGDEDAVGQGSGGGPGVLGNEAAVGQTPSVGGGPGVLGDEAAVGTTPSTGGGTGTLGNEADVSGTDQGITGNETSTGTTGGVLGDQDTANGPIELVVETVEVDVVAAEGGTSTGIPPDYEPNQYAGASGYFTVTQGGILGIGGSTLQIPLSAVMSVNPGQSVTLSVTKEDAEQLYSGQSQSTTGNP